MKTVDNILREMRRLADEAERGNCYDLSGLSTDSLRAYTDLIEAAYIREIAELRKGISELLDALQAIYDEECTSYGTGEVYDKWRKALKGSSND